MNPEDWKKIALAIYKRKDHGYKGFVITHGTDTMHFSASAVAFALGKNLNFPVVFTGAQTVPNVKHGDARVNLVRAVKVAATSNIAEVLISFGDYVFRGCRAQKKDERLFDAFESPAIQPLARITGELIVHSSAQLCKEGMPEIEFENNFAPNIVQVSLIPGLEPRLLKPLIDNPDCEGIILQSFGAGNVPNEKEDYSWGSFIKESTALYKPVLITSQFPANATLHTEYAPGQDAIKAGAISTGNMTSACATAKFRWVLAKVKADKISDENKISEVRKRMNTMNIWEFDLTDKEFI